MKKVCNVNKNDKLILKNLYQNKEGLIVKTLIKLTNLKQRVVYKRLNILRGKGLLENVFPIWKIVNGQIDFCAKLIKSSNIFELHNISYVVKLLKKPDWWSKRKNYLIRLKEWQFKNINFGKANSNPYQQLMNENFVIQCYPESLIIIARKRYYSNNPHETSIKALSDILDILKWFCERFRFNFFCDGIPHLEVRNNDFNRLNDALANQIKKQKGKFLVRIDERRKVWVDMSEPFGKEANYPSGQEKLERVTKDILLNNPQLPSEVDRILKENVLQLNKTIQIMNGIQQNQMEKSKSDLFYAKQITSHIKAVQELGKGVRNLTSAVTSISKENKYLKEKIKEKEQKRLSDFIK